MDEMTVFEAQLAERVRVFARTGSGSVDSAAVAHAVATVHPRHAGNGRVGRWFGLTFDRRVLTIAVALGLLVAFGGALLVGARLLVPPPLNVSPTVTNGWIALTVGQQTKGGEEEDDDIWLVGLDRSPRRVIGTDTDVVDQLCPAFSPDGRSLAYGRVEGHGTDYFVNADGTEGSQPAAYRQAALVVADVSEDGQVSDRLTIDVGDGLPPPCPVWSPDSDRLAFGAPRTPPVNPETSAAGSEVWIVDLADRGITVLPDLLATDLEWSPDGSTLAIAGGEGDRVPGEILRDGRIHLYALASGAMRSLDETVGAGQLTWSPDGRRIAYATGDSRHDLRVIDVETGQQEVLAAGFEAIHGIGPVWSPDGEGIVYQRVCKAHPADSSRPCREQHEVVVVTPGDPANESAAPREVVIPAFQVTADGSGWYLFPFRVTWSPDGEYLLYLAWTETDGSLPGLLVAVPTDPEKPAVSLAQMEGLGGDDGYPDTTHVPIQTWGRAPSD